MAEQGRLKRRLAGWLKARLVDMELDQVHDPRAARAKRWPLKTLLVAVIAAMAAGSKSLAQAEALTAEMSLPMRRLLGIARRVSDTTMRDVLCSLDPMKLRRVLHWVVRAAWRRKALEPDGLPFGVVSLDGKCTAIEDTHRPLYSQAQTRADGSSYGLARSVTAALSSARGCPCIDLVPIPSWTNEMGAFEQVLDLLERAYGRLLHSMAKVLTYDAGACSLANAGLVVARGFDYVFRLKEDQPTLLREAERVLGPLGSERAWASTEDVVGARVVTRRVWLTRAMAGFVDWSHLDAVVRIDSQTVDRRGTVVAHESRYYLSSLAPKRLSGAQWLRLIRGHWGVENHCHNLYDTAFAEDDRPWITADAQGFINVAIVRRLVATLLTLFRSVTQRSQERRLTPWRDLLRAVYNTVISATESHLANLRPRLATATR